MNTDTQDVHFISRSIGSTGLVIFERDGVLLKGAAFPGDVRLGDINEQLVRMLHVLRKDNIRFGFVSKETEIGRGSYGWPDYIQLTEMLDALLRVRRASPDFWLAQTAPASLEHQNHRREKPETRMILRVIERYGAEKSRTIFVTSHPAGIIAAEEADITGIVYSGWQNDATTSDARQMQIDSVGPDVRDLRAVRLMIEHVTGRGRESV